VVLVGAGGKIPPEQAAKTVASLQSEYERTMKQFMERLVAEAQPHVRTELTAQVSAFPREDSIAIIRALFADDPLPAFDRYKGPRLLVFASSADAQGGLQKARPQAKQKGIEGTSHWPHLDKPREFNQALDEFLAGIR
jgi:pimeloyl-ACP methyl ester carboxylesterase